MTAGGIDNEKVSFGDTVGAVAIDTRGDVAAATSTGGTKPKLPGRVGDVPLVGSGGYADNLTAAASATGHGEYFIRATVARDIYARVQYTGMNLQDAANAVIHDQLTQMGGNGGIIAVDPKGEVSLTFNTAGMYRASINRQGEVYVAIYKDE